jgi:hypothetical protein
MGFRTRRVGFDIWSGVGLAAVVGIPGLALYFAARAIGINTTVVPEALPFLWWTVPVLLLSAVSNALLEEVVDVGYLMNRLREMSLSVPLAVAASALLRGSYLRRVHRQRHHGSCVRIVLCSLKTREPVDHRSCNPGFRCLCRICSSAQSSGLSWHMKRSRTIPILMALAAAVVSCSPQGVQARLPVIGESTHSFKNVDSKEIVLSFGTTDPALVPNDYSVATATMMSPLITGWSRQNQTVRDGELLSSMHPLLGAIKVAVHVDASGTVTYSGSMRDGQSRFIAIVSADGTFSFDQILVASLVETVYPPVQSYQMYAHSTFTGTIARDGGYGGSGSAVNLTSTLAYERPPNPDITAPTGTEGYSITFAVKSVPSKSFFRDAILSMGRRIF